MGGRETDEFAIQFNDLSVRQRIVEPQEYENGGNRLLLHPNSKPLQTLNILDQANRNIAHGLGSLHFIIYMGGGVDLALGTTKSANPTTLTNILRIRTQIQLNTNAT